MAPAEYRIESDRPLSGRWLPLAGNPPWIVGNRALAVVAYQLARDERLGEAALPSLALVLVGLIPVMLLSRTLRR